MKKLVVASLMLGLVACGSNDDSSTTASVSSITGKFVDDPVVGLKYVIGGKEALTNEDGNFTCKAGDNVSFYIGDLKLGEASCGETITPLDLAGTQDTTNIKVQNMAVLLQNINDETSAGVIRIPETLHKIKFSDLKLDEAAEADFKTAYDAIPNLDAATVSRADAKTRLEKGVKNRLHGRKAVMSFTTDDKCNTLDGVDVSGSFTIDTNSGEGNPTFNAGNFTIKSQYGGATYPFSKVTEGGASTSTNLKSFTLTQNLLGIYKDAAKSPNKDLVKDPWACDLPKNDKDNLTKLNVKFTFNFDNSNEGTGTMHETSQCDTDPVTTLKCGTFKFKIQK